LTDLPYTTTDSASKVLTTTIPAAIVASTATAAASGYQPGDVAFGLSPKFLEVLNKIAKDVESTPCGARKRQVCQARAQTFAQRVAQELQPGGLLDWVRDIPTATVTASDIASVINFIADARVLSITSIALAAYKFGLEPVFKLLSGMTSALSSSSGGGGGSNSKNCPKTEELPCTLCAGANKVCTKAFAGCPCEEDKCPSRDQKPKCDDDKCKGDQHNKCTADNKGCDCNRDCPEAVEDWPFCDECGGRETVLPIPIRLLTNEGKCNGVSPPYDAAVPLIDLDCGSKTRTINTRVASAMHFPIAISIRTKKSWTWRRPSARLPTGSLRLHLHHRLRLHKRHPQTINATIKGIYR